MKHKTIITCALTGSADTPKKNPAVPVTPEQIARSAVEAARAGAAIVHVHVRDPKTTRPSMDPALYREVVARIRESDTDVVINLTTGPGARFVPGEVDPLPPGPGTTLAAPEERVVHVEELRPEICSLDVGTMNFGEHVFMNTPAHLRIMADRIRAAGIRPEIEVFDTGHVEYARQLIADGHVAAPVLFQLCLGIPWGAPATAQSMLHMRNLLPEGSFWSAFGISRHQFPMAAQAVLLGGHVRVGFEDNLYLGHGELAAGNGALVARAVEIIQLLGSEPATPAEARALYGLRSAVAA